MSLRVPSAIERYRVTVGVLASEPGERFGAFVLPALTRDRRLVCIATDGADFDGGLPAAVGWEHVSVSARQGKHIRVPTWDEMDTVKRLFWPDTDVVMQLHVHGDAKVDNIDVLHLWRHTSIVIPLPPEILVGIPGADLREVASV